MSWHECVRATRQWCVINCHSQCLPFLEPYLASYLDDLFLIITFYLFDQKYLLSPKLSEFPILSPPSTPLEVLHHNRQGTTAVLNLQDILTMPHPF